MAKGTGMEIAEFFTKLGFKIDDKELKKYEKSLNDLKKVALSYKKVADSIKPTTQTKMAMDSLKIQEKELKVKNQQLSAQAKMQQISQREAREAERRLKKTQPRGGGTRTPDNLRGFMGNSETVIRLKQDLRSLQDRYREAFDIKNHTTKARWELRKLGRQFKKGELSLSQYKEAMVKWKREAREGIGVTTRQIKKQQELHWVLKRTKNSFIQYAGAIGSVYAAVAVGQDVFAKGKEIEGIEAAMLGASGSADLAADRIKFLREESERIGVNFLGIGRAFTQLSFAAKGKLGENELRELFTGMSQFGTTMKVDAEQMKRGFMAVQQINLVCL